MCGKLGWVIERPSSLYFSKFTSNHSSLLFKFSFPLFVYSIFTFVFFMIIFWLNSIPVMRRWMIVTVGTDGRQQRVSIFLIFVSFLLFFFFFSFFAREFYMAPSILLGLYNKMFLHCFFFCLFAFSFKLFINHLLPSILSFFVTIFFNRYIFH